MEGSSASTTRASAQEGSTSGSTAGLVEASTKMVENGSQLPTAPVPDCEEATTTNPSMNGLEAHFTNGGGDAVTRIQSSPSSSGSQITTNGGGGGGIFATPSSSSTPLPIAATISATTTTVSAQPPNANDQSNTHHLGPALSMEEAAGLAAEKASNSALSSGGDGPAGKGKEEKRVGCAHYKRRAKFVTPCCNQLYMCRYCHDEVETHYFNRKTVTQLICTECDTRQKVQAECEKCGVRFGKYTCLVCNLFDDEDKNQYHCDGCGICRVGGKDRFFHCEVCNMCLPMQLKIDGHRCVENVSRSNCPVCLEDIHTSRIPCHIPDCGHLIHRTCFEELLSSGHYACPTCQTSMIDMKKLWDYLDAEVENSPMPKEYASYFVDILCKDCHKESNIPYHVVGLKCAHCGAYNTCQTKRTGKGPVLEGRGGGGAGNLDPPPPPSPPPGMIG